MTWSETPAHLLSNSWERWRLAKTKQVMMNTPGEQASCHSAKMRCSSKETMLDKGGPNYLGDEPGSGTRYHLPCFCTWVASPLCHSIIHFLKMGDGYTTPLPCCFVGFLLFLRLPLLQTSLPVLWPGLRVPNAMGLGLIPGHGTRSHM